MSERFERPRVLILCYTHLATDSRVLRQVRSLSEVYDVTSATFGPSPVPGVEHIELRDPPPYRHPWIGRLIYIALFSLRIFPFLMRLNYRDRAALTALAGREWDVILANDVDTVPLALKLGARYGVLADLHEYSSRQDEHSIIWRLVLAPYARWLVRKTAKGVDAVTTVSHGIAEEYRREFGIDAEVVTNASDFRSLAPTPVGSTIRLVHSGVPAVQRRLELMIDAMRLTAAEVTLDFYLLEDGSHYLSELKERAAGLATVRFNPPVASGKLVDALNQYDVGLSIFAPTTFNLAWCLPNKFFDYVQARLGVIIGPSPEMQRIVKQRGIGSVLKDFTAESLAEVLEGLRPEVVHEWKRASDRHARELSSGPQSLVWHNAIESVIASAA